MIVATSSSISKFKFCHKAYFFAYDLCIKPKKPRWPLIDGDVFHGALERYYLLGRQVEEEGIKSSKRGPEASFMGEIIEYIDNHSSFFLGGENDRRYHQALVRGMFKGYANIYPPTEFQQFKPEIKFQVEVPNPLLDKGKYILAGKTDGLVECNHKPYLFETKTTSESSITKFLERLFLAYQPNRYLYGFNRMDIRAIGIIYNVVRKCKLRQNQFESDEGFYKRIERAYLDDAKRVKEGKESKYYFREIIYRSPSEMKEWLEEEHQVVKDMCAYYQYKSPDRCNDFGECEFKPLCMGADVLESMYVKKKCMHEEINL